MAPPHFQGSVGSGTSCAQRISWTLPKKPLKLGYLQKTHPVRHHRLPPKLLRVRVSRRAFRGLQAIAGAFQGAYKVLRGLRSGLGTPLEGRRTCEATEDLGRWVGGMPIKAKIDVHCVDLAQRGGEAKEPGGALYIHSP